MTFYLKVNRLESYTYHNLQHWIDAIKLLADSKVYILCDNDVLKNNILSRVNLEHLKVEFLKSYKSSSELNHIVSNITDERWSNAGYAHLSTFLHARENGFDQFWNIDADDTFVCLPPKRVCQMLGEVEKKADKNKIDIFSLDMWRTREPKHWTFGITYTINPVGWMEIMNQHCRDIGLKQHTHREKNVDSFFSYLKINTNLKIETFYFENLKFIHYSNDFFRRTIVSGIFHWREGKLCFPILYYCFGLESLGLLPIAEDIIKLDIGITTQETNLFMVEKSMDRHLIDEYASVLNGSGKNAM